MRPFARQYEEYPYMPMPEPSTEPAPPQQQEEQPKESGSGKMKIILIAVIGIVLLVIVYFVFFSGGEKSYVDEIPDDNTGTPGGSNEPPVSGGDENETTPREKINLAGNGKCDPGENCYDDSADCKCKPIEYCSAQKICREPSCGNKQCEANGGESAETCCLDCLCKIPGQICNQETRVCEFGKTSLTEEKAAELVRVYFESQGTFVNSTQSLGVYSYNQTLVQRVKVWLVGEDFSRQLVVTDSENVIDLNLL